MLTCEVRFDARKYVSRVLRIVDFESERGREEEEEERQREVEWELPCERRSLHFCSGRMRDTREAEFQSKTTSISAK